MAAMITLESEQLRTLFEKTWDEAIASCYCEDCESPNIVGKGFSESDRARHHDNGTIMAILARQAGEVEVNE